MQTIIKLQEPFTYSKVPLVIGILLIIAITYYLFHKKKVKEQENKEKIPQSPKFEKKTKNVSSIKQKYINQLDLVEQKYESQKIELRKAYQMISEIIRVFVFEVTDITTQNYSLAEIEKLNIPTLYDLIKEYYEPEFASKSVGDFKASINKARRVINEWK